MSPLVMPPLPSLVAPEYVAVPMPNASAQCGAVIDRHVPKTGGTTVRTFLRHNANLGGCYYAGYDVSSTWKSRVGFNHMNFLEIARGVAKGGRSWCVEAHVVAETFWQDLAVLRNTLSLARLQAPRSPLCTIVTLVRVREPYSWYKSCAPARHRTEPPAHALARSPHRNPLVGSLPSAAASPMARLALADYRWAVLERQRGGMPNATWGANFTDWLPYNLQSQHLLIGDRVSVGTKRGVALSRRPRRRDLRRPSDAH